MSVLAATVTSSSVVVAVDVGKCSVALSVTGAQRHRLLGPVEFAMTRSALADEAFDKLRVMSQYQHRKLSAVARSIREVAVRRAQARRNGP